MRVNQLSLYEAGEVGEKDDWTFQGAETRSLTHCYHDYPARMIPQIAGKLLDLFAPKHPALLFDPYCGTGTSLVEGMIRGLNVVGTDLNPLARLIAHAKTTLASVEMLDDYIKELWAYLRLPDSEEPLDMTLDGISRPEFWFKPEVFKQLARLRKFVTCIENTEARNFFAIAFSETARESSNTRRDEFKLYRYAESDLERHKPAPFQIMFAKLARNRNGLMALQEVMEGATPSIAIHDFNTVSGVPTRLLPPDSVDVVVTSPPYGDSQTTVAYGQYSRLSSAWLGLPDGGSVDSALMGGKKTKTLPVFSCANLDDALASIAQIDRDRALHVATFYKDLKASITHIAPLVKSGGYVAYVVGNRKVKGVLLPTNEAVRSLFEAVGYVYETTFLRGIPNKRMPSRNSPTNAPGKTEQTMLCEYIVVMRRV